MSDQQFDELARRLAQPMSRRRAFKALAGAIVGGILLKGGAADAFAKQDGGGNGNTNNGNGGDCVGLGQHCTPGAGHPCCVGQCLPSEAGNNGHRTCQCPSGQRQCGSTCAQCCSAADCPPSTNPCQKAVCTSTGTCGLAPNPGGTCTVPNPNPCRSYACDANGGCTGTPIANKACTLPSGGPGLCCNGTCTNITTNANCGTCGNVCTGGNTCQPTPGGTSTCQCGTTGAACPAGSVCDNGTCFSTCNNPDPTNKAQPACGAPGSSCVCVTDTSGNAVCVQKRAACPTGMGTDQYCSSNTDCPGGSVCIPNPYCGGKGVCNAPCGACPSGLVLCNGLCTTTSSDNANCGACGNACPTGTSCVNGICLCADNRKPCGSPPTCCLSCETCDATGTCASNCPDPCTVCNATAGTPGFGTCTPKCTGSTPNCCGGTCTSFQSDNANCGSCGNACTGGTTCVQGICSTMCAPAGGTGGTNFPNCGAPGVNGSCLCGTTTAGQQVCFQNNTGYCSTSSPPCGDCGSGQYCIQDTSFCPSGAYCGFPCTCPAGGTFCNGVCVDTSSSNANCGKCGNACPSGTTCCNGTCADTSSDVNNCGACGIPCQNGQTCQSGQCVSVCTTGTFCGVSGGTPNCCTGSTPDCCGTTCTNLSNDLNHCGKCSVACQAGESCQSGQCVSVCPTGTSFCGFTNGVANCCGANEKCTGGSCVCSQFVCGGAGTGPNCCPVGTTMCNQAGGCACPNGVEPCAVNNGVATCCGVGSNPPFCSNGACVAPPCPAPSTSSCPGGGGAGVCCPPGTVACDAITGGCLCGPVGDLHKPCVDSAGNAVCCGLNGSGPNCVNGVCTGTCPPGTGEQCSASTCCPIGTHCFQIPQGGGFDCQCDNNGVFCGVDASGNAVCCTGNTPVCSNGRCIR